MRKAVIQKVNQHSSEIQKSQRQSIQERKLRYKETEVAKAINGAKEKMMTA